MPQYCETDENLINELKRKHRRKEEKDGGSEQVRRGKKLNLGLLHKATLSANPPYRKSEYVVSIVRPVSMRGCVPIFSTKCIP